MDWPLSHNGESTRNWRAMLIKECQVRLLSGGSRRRPYRVQTLGSKSRNSFIEEFARCVTKTRLLRDPHKASARALLSFARRATFLSAFTYPVVII
jgi:hypothetical protein